MEQNRGFSLVELIIVVAIMAILTGILAPLLIKYVEKTNVSHDTQVCDTIHEAFKIAMADPEVLTDPKSQEMLYESGGLMDPATSSSGGNRLDHYQADSDWTNCAFAKEVTDIVGFDPFVMGGDHSQYLKSGTANERGIICVVPNENGTDCAVYIAWSDRTGGKDGENYNDSYAGLEDSKVIFVK